jgi:proline racemase
MVTTPNVPSVQCKAVAKSTGKRCQRKAIPGGTVCRNHGGAAPAVKAKAAVRAEVMSWGLGDLNVDPGEILLRLVSQSAARAAMYAVELEQLVAASPSLRDALIDEIWISTDKGESYKAGEYIRGLAKLEADERDRCANFAAKAVAAGLAERQVRLAEKQAVLFAAGMRAVLDALNLTPEQKALEPKIVAEQFAMLAVS